MLDVHMRVTHIATMTLDAYLSAHGITEATFAASIGVDQSTVNRIRRGQIPSPDVMRAIAAATANTVTPNDLFGVPSNPTERKEAA